MSSFTVGLCQVDPGEDKASNVSTATSLLETAVDAGADLVAFPENLDYSGAAERRTEVAEPIPGPTTRTFADLAAQHGVHVLLGSLHETAGDGRKRNTSVLVDDTGEIVATYTKIHLFDATVGDQVNAAESATTDAGDGPVVVDTDLGRFGLSICYDLRFPGLYRALAAHEVDVVFVPSSFMLHTGKDHWEPLLRARAIESQAYVVAPDQIGRKADGSERYGKSMVVDPWGTVVRQASDRVCVTTTEIDLAYVERVREELPSLAHARPDAYGSVRIEDARSER